MYVFGHGEDNGPRRRLGDDDSHVGVVQEAPARSLKLGRWALKKLAVNSKHRLWTTERPVSAADDILSPVWRQCVFLVSLSRLWGIGNKACRHIFRFWFAPPNLLHVPSTDLQGRLIFSTILCCESKSWRRVFRTIAHSPFNHQVATIDDSSTTSCDHLFAVAARASRSSRRRMARSTTSNGGRLRQEPNPLPCAPSGLSRKTLTRV